MDVVPHISVYPDRIITWNSFEGLEIKNRNINGLKLNNPNAALSQKGSKRLNNAINWLVHLSKHQQVNDGRLKSKFNFQINFITLSLPSQQIKSYKLPCGKEIFKNDYTKFIPAHNINFGSFTYEYSDKWIKSNLLNQFLTELRQKYKSVCYVWKAETQQNGNIHFHITTNKYIYLGELRTMWNRILDKTNFISRYQDRFKNMSFDDYYLYRNRFQSVSSKKCMKAYEYGVRTNWLDPNSTDIHAVNNIRDIAAYLSKYFRKGYEAYTNKRGNVHQECRKVDGCLWRLSERLSKFRCAHALIDTEISMEFNWLVKNFPRKFKPVDYASILYVKVKDIFCLFRNSRIVDMFSKYVDKILHPELYPPENPPPSLIPVSPSIIIPQYFQSSLSF
jgi:hypothetical protein